MAECERLNFGSSESSTFKTTRQCTKYVFISSQLLYKYLLPSQESCCWLNSGSIAEMTGLYTEDDITEAVCLSSSSSHEQKSYMFVVGS